MNENIIEEIKKTILEVVNVDISKYPESTKINEISEWDSFNNLMLISRFQEQYNVEFTALEIENTQTIADLIKLIMGKLTNN